MEKVLQNKHLRMCSYHFRGSFINWRNSFQQITDNRRNRQLNNDVIGIYQIVSFFDISNAFDLSIDASFT